MANKKYLVVYHGLATVVPKLLREFVKRKITDEFSPFDLELDFTGTRTDHDLTVTFSNEIPGWPCSVKALAHSSMINCCVATRQFTCAP